MFVFTNTMLELVKFYLLFRFGFHLELRKKSVCADLIVICISVLYAFVINYFGVDSFGIYILWIIIVMNILFADKLLRLLLWTIGAVAFIGLLDSFSVIIVKVASILLQFTWRQSIYDILASVLTILVLIITYTFIFKSERGFFLKIGYRRMLQIYLFGFCYTLLLTLVWDNLTERITTFQNGMNDYAIFLLVVVSAYYQIVSMIQLALSNRKLQEKDRINQNLMKLQENHYEYLKSTDQNTRKFRHDVRNHILVLTNLCKEKQFHEMEEYLDQISGRFESISSSHHVNHSIVDAILNQFSSLYGEQNITFQVKGHLPSDCCIAYYDISTIITNMLQNAYEAVCECERKEVYLTIRYDDFRLYLQEENTFCHELILKNGRLQSRKVDLKSHGLGMENIMDSVQKYKGNLYYETIGLENEQKRFVLKVILNYK